MSEEKLNLVPAIRQIEEQIMKIEWEYKIKARPYHDSLKALRKLNTACEKCNGKGKVLRSRVCAEDDRPDPTIREYVIQRLSADLMKSISLATCFGGEIIVSLGPVKESQIKDLCSVRFEQSMRLTPLVRCRDCKHYVESDEVNGKFMCVKDADWCVEDGCYYGFTDYPPAEFYCAAGERKDGGQDK